MKAYIEGLEKELAAIKNGFKEEEKRAWADFKANNQADSKKLAYLAYQSAIYTSENVWRLSFWLSVGR